MFGLNKKSKVSAPKSWNELSKYQQKKITSKLIKTIRAFNLGGAKYKVISSPYELQRERGQAETVGEDKILDAHQRLKLLNLARNQVRNSPEFNALLKTLDLNAVGNGGKVVIGIDSDDARKIRDEFAKWCHNAEYFDSLSFKEILKIILKEYILGGDCVMLYDTVLENSGKLLVYESDEIGDCSKETVEKHYGKGAESSLGKVRNANGRWIGTIVSRSQRGQTEFDEDKCFFLSRDPDGNVNDEIWLQPSNVFRSHQGRGITQIASIIPSVDDIATMVDLELQSAKKNASMIAQIYNTDSSSGETVSIPSAFSSEQIQSMTDEQIQELIDATKSESVEQISLQQLHAAGVCFESMPKNYKLEMLTSDNHPNSNLKDFVLFLQSRAAGVFGLGQYYATLGQSGDFKADSIISWSAFYDAQKFLESICDWVFIKWARYADEKGIIDISKLGDGWERKISWVWPKKDDTDEVAKQNGIRLGLQNMTMTYRDVLGADWKEKLLQSKVEIDWLKANGLPIPAYNMISGGEKTGVDIDPTETDDLTND